MARAKPRRKLFEVKVRGVDEGEFMHVWAATPAGAISHGLADVKSKRLRNTVKVVEVSEIIQGHLGGTPAATLAP